MSRGLDDLDPAFATGSMDIFAEPFAPELYSF